MLKTDSDVPGDIVQVKAASQYAIAQMTRPGADPEMIMEDYAHCIDTAIKSTRLLVIETEEGPPAALVIYMN